MTYYIVQELCSLIFKKSPKKKIGILISLKCFVPAQYKRMQFVDNTRACLKNRQVSYYQPLAFEVNGFCLGTPVAFPQHVLLDVKLHKDN